MSKIRICSGFRELSDKIKLLLELLPEPNTSDAILIAEPFEWKSIGQVASHLEAGNLKLQFDISYFS